MKRGWIAAVAAAVGISAGIIGAPVPTGAQVPTDHKIVAGNFAAGPRDEFFYYTPGAGPDTLYIITMVSGMPQIQAVGSFTISGNYTPLVGDFDADGFDEILWYAPGFAADYMWNFTSYTTVASKSYPVNGVYQPTVGDYTGDRADDILWYAPGFTADYLWDYNAGGTFTSVPRTINGRYQPVSGSFGNDRTDDIFWYAPGSTADFLWDYVPGSTSYQGTNQTVNGFYRPFSLDIYNDGPGSEDIFWYAPGAAVDGVWDFYRGQLISDTTAVGGDYLTAAGDYFGGGTDDILFENASDLLLREHTLDAAGFLHVTDWTFVPAAASDARVLSEVSGALPTARGVSVRSETLPAR